MDKYTANEFELPDSTPIPAGSLILNGIVHGWTGQKCPLCEICEEGRVCNGCGGTEEFHGPMYRWEE